EEVSVAREPVTRSARDRRTFLRLSAGVATVLPLTALAGCGGRNTDPGTIRVAFQQFGSGTIKEQWITTAAEEFSAENPELTVDPGRFVPSASCSFSQNELLMRSPRTSPDLVYEASFILRTDVRAGYLQPMMDLG